MGNWRKEVGHIVYDDHVECVLSDVLKIALYEYAVCELHSRTVDVRVNFWVHYTPVGESRT